MIARLEVFSKIPDTRAQVLKRKFENRGFRGKIDEVFLADVYTVDLKSSKKDLERFALSLYNPVTHEAEIRNGHRVKTNPKRRFDWAIEIGFLPGVTDNVAHTAWELAPGNIKNSTTSEQSIFTSKLIFIKGSLGKKNIDELALQLANPLIQRVSVKSLKTFVEDGGMDLIVPRVALHGEPAVLKIDLNASDEALAEIGKKGIMGNDGMRRGPLALDLPAMKAIRDHFKKSARNPTDIELESIAQTWSEHCKHTIFNDPIDDLPKGLFRTYIRTATEKIRKQKGRKDICASVFTDNAGAIIFDKNYLITHKVETHNSPSALDPFGGSITGIVGVNRDAIGFGLGAKPVANTYGFCFGDLWSDRPLYRDAKLTSGMLSPRRIMEGVIEGVNSGGNCSGIPTPQGTVYFQERYGGKPLVFVGTLGLIPKKKGKKFLYEKKARPGDLIIMVGGKVGLDGIHGATFSSEALDSGSPATAVQIGDPITQKKLSDTLVKEARNLDLYDSITDNGAGGLSCSVAEMAKECNGCEVNLEKVPLKYPGLDPWQIWISESQERMTLAVPKSKWKKLNDLFNRRGVEAWEIGRFTSSGKCLVKLNSHVVMNLDMDFLHDGLPPKKLITKKPPVTRDKHNFREAKDISRELLAFLSWPNIAGYQFISTQYDHEVQASSVLKPLVGRGLINSEVSVIRPVLESSRVVFLSQAMYPSYTELDPYAMAGCAIDSAVRNIVASGGDLEHIALVDNFCWCSALERERLWQLKMAAKACFDFAVAFGTPFISGKDSMFNDFSGYDHAGKQIKISALPTLLISSLGVGESANKIVSLDFKFPGDLIYVLGKTDEEMGGSEYFVFKKVNGGKVPLPRLKENVALYKKYFQATQKGLVTSSISVTRGGLGVALSKSAIGGMLGVDVSLAGLLGSGKTEALALFSESQGRMIVSVNPQRKREFERVMRGIAFRHIGEVSDKKIVIKGFSGKEIVDIDLGKAYAAYHKTFKEF